MATSALGMGYDKPDLAFVVHFQSPGSPIAYYQQIGRAGRALDTAAVVLLRGHEDRDIQDWFIETAFPDQVDAEAVVAFLESQDEPVGVGRHRADRQPAPLPPGRDAQGARGRGGGRPPRREVVPHRAGRGPTTPTGSSGSPPSAAGSRRPWTSSAPRTAASCSSCWPSSTTRPPGRAAGAATARRWRRSRSTRPRWPGPSSSSGVSPCSSSPGASGRRAWTRYGAGSRPSSWSRRAGPSACGPTAAGAPASAPGARPGPTPTSWWAPPPDWSTAGRPAPAPTWVTAVPSADRPEVAAFAEALADALDLPFVAVVSAGPGQGPAVDSGEQRPAGPQRARGLRRRG